MPDPLPIQPRRDEQGVPWCDAHCPMLVTTGDFYCHIQRLNTIGEPCLPAVREMAEELAAATELLRSDCTGQGTRPLYGLNEELGQAGYWYRGQWIGGEIRDVIRAAAKEREGHDA